MLGGLFADAGSWRAVFWLFAVQGAAVAAAAWVMLPAAETTDAQHAVAWRQLGLIALGVTLIALADLAGDFARTAGLTALGVMVFLLALRLDGRSEVRLLPRGSGDLSTAHGAGFATMFLLNAAAMGLPVYGPAILQTLQGLSALLAGYVVGAEALLWTAAALPVSGLTGRMARPADPVRVRHDPRRPGTLCTGLQWHPAHLGGVRVWPDRGGVRLFVGVHQPAYPWRPGR